MTAAAIPYQALEIIAVSALIPYARNSRTHSETQVGQIAASIREFGFTNPVLIADDNTVIAGHGRLLAAQKLGLADVPCLRLSGMTEAQRRAYIIADNKLALNAGWDDELLALELGDLRDSGFDLGVIGFSDDDLAGLLLDEADNDNAPGDGAGGSGSLAERFMLPPFTVLNAREGWWQDRKSKWIGIGIRSELGRGEDGTAQSFASQEKLNGIMASKNAGAATADSGILFSLSSQPPEVYDKKKAHEKKIGRSVTWEEFYAVAPEVFQESGTSIFDPVLCEIAYRWFCPPDGLILDPFAGGSVRGIVAAKVGRQYIGHELRGEQVAANRDQAALICGDDLIVPAWVEGDSRNIDKTCADVDADLVFTCPPYADLEVYSDDPADLSTLGYDDFRAAYFEIIAKACARLKSDRFAVCVVGEVRDKRGNYYDFVGDTVQAFRDAGLQYYNEAILVTAVGSLPIRAGRQFAASRKLGKTHQNVLVFVKGDGKAAALACGPVEVEVPDDAGGGAANVNAAPNIAAVA